jgi:protein transport protein SEC39
MAELASLGDAQVILLAVQLASDAEVERLHQLSARRPDVLNATVLYRILLTHLPVDASLSPLISLLGGVQGDELHPESFDSPIDLSNVQDLNALAARKRAFQLRLDKAPQVSENPLTCFLIARAHQIEGTNGDLPSILQLVEPFLDQDDILRTWVTSKLLPLLRLQYEYYPEAQVVPNLREMERLQGTAGVSRLLQNTTNASPGRDLRGVVAPWIYGENAAKRRKTGGESKLESTSWRDANEWILGSSVNDLPLAAAAINDWGGPRDIDMGGYEDPTSPADDEDEDVERRYQQTALAIIYSSEDTTQDALALSGAVLERAANLAGLLPPDRFKTMPLVEHLPAELASITQASLLQNVLLQPGNVLTRPSSLSVSFLEALLASLRILKGFRVDMTVRAGAELCLFGNEEQQKRELHRLLEQIPRMTSTEIDWRNTQAKLLYLKSWTGTQGKLTSEHPHGLLWRVPTTAVHEELFRAMLTANNHQMAIELFLQEKEPLLPLSILEACVKASIFNAYDNASNGNRTRGGIKRAYDLLKAFQHHFPDSDLFRQVDHLIAATHSLSYYQLTLQHGVPFQPVSIRVHKDPMSLIDKVLEQNLRAYTKVDDLQGIGMNIVLAGLPATTDPEDMGKSTQTRLSEAEQRVTFAAISSALAQHDFDTAYSYITTRLSQQSTETTTDDTSWRAAYAAGRYRPPSTPQSSVSRMASLSKRMDLLSLALTLCSSPDHLPEILDVWCRCEEEMDSLKREEAEEERAWEKKSNHFSQTSVPGEFGGFEDRDVDIADTKHAMASRSSTLRSPKGCEDEAPMGLFDVARGAAAAIQKSAFPLRAATQRQASMASAGHRSQSSIDDGRPGSPLSGDVDRVRKRDMVSSAVTGSLLKGMSWALGAEPVTQRQDEKH